VTGGSNAARRAPVINRRQAALSIKTALRLLGISPTTGAAPRNIMRSDIAQPGGFCRGVRDGSVLEYVTRAATTARRAPVINRRQAALSIKTALRLLGISPTQAASHPGFRSNIAKQGVFCRGVRDGSVLEYVTRAATTARRAPSNFACRADKPGDRRKTSRRKSGAISHSRAGFAEESAMGAYLST